MTLASLKEDLHAVYMRYADGFRKNDVSLIDSVVSYPIGYLMDGNVEMLDRYPVDPMTLKQDKGWDHSTDWHFDILAVNAIHAHAVASATRRRADGSMIERVHGFYAFVRVDDTWKMYAFSEMVS